MSNKDRWSALSMSERADFIKKAINAGITKRKDIIDTYNTIASEDYADIEPAVVEADYPRENEVWKRADSSNADMVQRLRQGSSRSTIPDWEDSRKVATHKMMSAGKYAVGNVQNINGQLFDFTDPKHGFKDPDRAAIDSAIKRGDFIEFDTEGDARYFAEHYKKHYKDFANGGRILDGKTDSTQTLSGTPVRRDSLPSKEYFNVEDTLLYSPSESTIFDSVAPLMVMKKDPLSEDASVDNIDTIINGPKFSVPKDNPERDFVKKANELIKDKSEADLKRELKSKNKDEVKSIQRQLADEGHYDIKLFKGKSSNASSIQKMLVKEGYLTDKDVDGNIGSYTTEKLQEMLVDKGYLSEFTDSGETNIDGNIGKRTREAFKQFNRDYNVDGIIGNRTLKGYLNKEGKKAQGFNTNVSAEGMVDQCAKWVSTKFDKVVGNTAQNGVFGNAWNMIKNIEDSGGQMLFNAYDSPYFDNVKDASGIKKGCGSIYEV